MPRLPSLFGALALFAGVAALLSAQEPDAPPVRKGKAGKKAGRLVKVAVAASDEQTLRDAGVDPEDGTKLVEYLKERTVPDTDRGRIDMLIKQFAASRFDERLKAGEELERYGPAAAGPLKAAEKDSDPEVAYRAALVLRRLEKVSHPAAAAAAVRAVVRLKPPGAAAALLGYLPLADSEALADDIRAALVALAAPGGQPDPALLAALADPSPVRRAAAYVALVEGAKAASPQVKEAVRKETDPDARFRGLWALALTTRDKEYVPNLIDMIPQLPRGRIWQLEDLLLQLAGKHPDGGRFGKTPASLAKAKDAWAGWWAAHGSALDPAKLDIKPRVRGFTDLVEYDQRGLGMGRVASLGPDMKEAWSLSVPNFNPSDARVLPNGRVLVVEQSYNRVTERDAAGTVTATHTAGQPISVHPTPDGGVVVVCRQLVVAFDKAGEKTWTYPRPTADVIAGARLPGGGAVFLTNAQKGPNCFRLDDKGKEADKGVELGRPLNLALTRMDVVDEHTVLVCEQQQVVEYDLRTGKAGWKYAVPYPTSVQRLPSGNTLIASPNLGAVGKVVEVDPAGEVVWEHQGKDGLRVARAFRR